MNMNKENNSHKCTSGIVEFAKFSSRNFKLDLLIATVLALIYAFSVHRLMQRIEVADESQTPQTPDTSESTKHRFDCNLLLRIFLVCWLQIILQINVIRSFFYMYSVCKDTQSSKH